MISQLDMQPQKPIIGKSQGTHTQFSTVIDDQAQPLSSIFEDEIHLTGLRKYIQVYQ